MIRNDSQKKVSISLPMELYEQIKTLSEESQRTTSAYIRQVLRVYLQYYAEHAEEAESDPLIVKWAVKRWCRMATSKRVFTLRLSEDVLDKIGKLATKEHRSVTNYIEFVLLQYLETNASSSEQQKTNPSRTR